jgi:hypothetical protein
VATATLVRAARGCSSMVEPQPSKLAMRVRFPSPALLSSCSSGRRSFPPHVLNTSSQVLACQIRARWHGSVVSELDWQPLRDHAVRAGSRVQIGSAARALSCPIRPIRSRIVVPGTLAASALPVCRRSWKCSPGAPTAATAADQPTSLPKFVPPQPGASRPGEDERVRLLPDVLREVLAVATRTRSANRFAC